MSIIDTLNSDFVFEKETSTDGLPWGPDYVHIHSSVMEKTAAECHTPESLLKVMKGLRERPEGVYVLLNALGAYEYWGVNRNGDAFPEWSLKGSPPPKDVADFLNSDSFKSKFPNFVVPTGRYGYKTFETDAHVYLLHANKDPLTAIGDVIAAAYNEHMHRVELIVFIYEARSKDTVTAIRNQLPVPWSMGAKLPFDICSVCCNPAKNRGAYCQHLLTSLNEILPDGRKVFSYNWFPRFFDISKVRIPADRSAWALRKVAAFTGKDMGYAVKSPNPIFDPSTVFVKVAGLIGKTGSMVKEAPTTESKSLGSAPIDPSLLQFVRDQVDCDNATTDDIIDPQLDQALKSQGLSRVLSALALAGIVLKPHELHRSMNVSQEKVPDKLDMPGVSSKLLVIVRKHIPQRSMVDPEFAERRKDAVKSESTKVAKVNVVDRDYTKYLDLLKKEAESIVEVASMPNIRINLYPDWASVCLFKKAGMSMTAESWLPFLTAVASRN